jgi:hypothetical protein
VLKVMDKQPRTPVVEWKVEREKSPIFAVARESILPLERSAHAPANPNLFHSLKTEDGRPRESSEKSTINDTLEPLSVKYLVKQCELFMQNAPPLMTDSEEESLQSASCSANVSALETNQSSSDNPVLFQTQGMPVLSAEKALPSVPQFSPDTLPKVPVNTSENTLPKVPVNISENTLPNVPVNTSENTLPKVPVHTSENTLPKVPVNTSETTLPIVPENTSENTLPKVPVNASENTLPKLPVCSNSSENLDHCEIEPVPLSSDTVQKVPIVPNSSKGVTLPDGHVCSADTCETEQVLSSATYPKVPEFPNSSENTLPNRPENNCTNLMVSSRDGENTSLKAPVSATTEETVLKETISTENSATLHEPTLCTEDNSPDTAVKRNVERNIPCSEGSTEENLTFMGKSAGSRKCETSKLRIAVSVTDDLHPLCNPESSDPSEQQSPESPPCSPNGPRSTHDHDIQRNFSEGEAANGNIDEGEPANLIENRTMNGNVRFDDHGLELQGTENSDTAPTPISSLNIGKVKGTVHVYLNHNAQSGNPTTVSRQEPRHPEHQGHQISYTDLLTDGEWCFFLIFFLYCGDTR